MRVRIACLGAALSLAACSTVLESTVDLDQEGVVYHLPRTLIELYIRPQATYDKEPKDANAQPFVVGSNQFYITATSTTIPDVNHRYLLKYTHNVLYNDRVCVSTLPSGMLASIEFASEDATPQIVVALASL